MEITAVHFLSPEQKQQIHSLEMACRKEYGSHLSFPSEDGDFFFLALKNNQLLGKVRTKIDVEHNKGQRPGSPLPKEPLHTFPECCACTHSLCS